MSEMKRNSIFVTLIVLFLFSVGIRAYFQYPKGMKGFDEILVVCVNLLMLFTLLWLLTCDVSYYWLGYLGIVAIIAVTHIFGFSQERLKSLYLVQQLKQTLPQKRHGADLSLLLENCKKDPNQVAAINRLQKDLD